MDPRSRTWRRVEAALIGLLLLTPLVIDPWGGLDAQYKALYMMLAAGLIAQRLNRTWDAFWRSRPLQRAA